MELSKRRKPCHYKRSLICLQGKSPQSTLTSIKQLAKNNDLTKIEFTLLLLFNNVISNDKTKKALISRRWITSPSIDFRIGPTLRLSMAYERGSLYNSGFSYDIWYPPISTQFIKILLIFCEMKGMFNFNDYFEMQLHRVKRMEKA